jgi:hypothetical protein
MTTLTIGVQKIANPTNALTGLFVIHAIRAVSAVSAAQLAQTQYKISSIGGSKGGLLNTDPPVFVSAKQGP